MYRHLVVLVVLLWGGRGVLGELSYDYYVESCPKAEDIIHTVVAMKQREVFTTAAGTLRIFFHDCFIQGCDASIMVASTRNNTAEKEAPDNLSLPGDGFDAVMRAKTALEDACPGVVSCADIIAIAARDLVVMVGGPFWPVLKGRKDGRVSKASSVPSNLPLPTMSVEELTRLFQRKGFTQEEMVALTGAHTIGFSHCGHFIKRIWNYSQSMDMDPTMSAAYARRLRSACPSVGSRVAMEMDEADVVAFNDVNTPHRFDNVYYKNMRKGEALLASDQAMWMDPRTRPIAKRLSRSDAAFFSAWIPAIQKLGLLNVNTHGEVRKHCHLVNPL